jgi:hypothetical protein
MRDLLSQPDIRLHKLFLSLQIFLRPIQHLDDSEQALSPTALKRSRTHLFPINELSHIFRRWQSYHVLPRRVGCRRGKGVQEKNLQNIVVPITPFLDV